MRGGQDWKVSVVSSNGTPWRERALEGGEFHKSLTVKRQGRLWWEKTVMSDPKPSFFDLLIRSSTAIIDPWVVRSGGGGCCGGLFGLFGWVCFDFQK